MAFRAVRDYPGRFAIMGSVPLDQPASRDKIAAPVLDPAENARINPVTLTVNLNAGFPLGTVTSPFHQTDMQTVDDMARTISLKGGSVPADPTPDGGPATL